MAARQGKGQSSRSLGSRISVGARRPPTRSSRTSMLAPLEKTSGSPARTIARICRSRPSSSKTPPSRDTISCVKAFFRSASSIWTHTTPSDATKTRNSPGLSAFRNCRSMACPRRWLRRIGPQSPFVRQCSGRFGYAGFERSRNGCRIPPACGDNRLTSHSAVMPHDFPLCIFDLIGSHNPVDQTQRHRLFGYQDFSASHGSASGPGCPSPCSQDRPPSSACEEGQ